MSIKIKKENDKTSLCIDGELTIYTAQQYWKEIVDDFVADKSLELDISGIEEVDTSGLQLLAAMDRKLSESGCEMKIIAASDVINEALQISCMMVEQHCGQQDNPS